MRCRPFLVAAGSVAILTAVASAGVVFSESFDDQADGDGPRSNGMAWFAVNFDESTVSIDAEAGNPGPAVIVRDTSTDPREVARAEINLGVQAFARFDMSRPGEEVLTFAFDLKVDSFSTPNDGHGSTPRVSIKNGSRHFVVGFGQANVPDGDGGGDLFLFAAEGGDTGQPAIVVPKAANALGFEEGRWVSGFDFGNVNSDPAENNTGGEFYRIEVTFTADSDEVGVKATQVFSGESVTTTRTVSEPFSFSNTGTDGLSILAPGVGTATFVVDNISLEVSGK